MSLTGQPSSSRRADKAPAERLTPLARRDLEIANLEHQVRDLRQQNDDLWSENDDFKAKEASWGTLLEDLEAREDDLKAKDEIIKGLSADLARQESEINSYKERHTELQTWLRKHYEETRAANERYGLEVAEAQEVTDKESGPVPLSASEKTQIKERAKPPQPQQPSPDTLALVSQGLRAANQSLESCRCSNGQDHSRKRTHRQIEGSERDGSSHSRKRREIHSENEPRSSNAHMEVPGQQNDVRPDGRILTDSPAPEAFRPAEPTITRSDRGDFSMLVSEVEVNSCTSDIIPDPVLAIIRQQIGRWTNRDANWTKKLKSQGRCVDRRIRHRSSDWADGVDYACSDCRDLGLVCSLLEKKGSLRFLPLKQSGETTKEPDEMGYWVELSE